MKIIVEDTEVDLDLPERDVKLHQVVTEVEDFLMSVGKVPVSLSIDGQTLTQEELESREQETLSGTEALSFGVQSIFAFLRDHLDGAERANKELLKNVLAFASEIHSSEKTVNGDQLVVELNHFFDFWMKIKRLLPQEFADQRFDNKTVEQVFEDLRGLFEEIVSAMEEQDFVLAADLLQYEVTPAIESFDRSIPDLKVRLTEREEIDRKEVEKMKAQ